MMRQWTIDSEAVRKSTGVRHVAQWWSGSDVTDTVVPVEGWERNLGDVDHAAGFLMRRWEHETYLAPA